MPHPPDWRTALVAGAVLTAACVADGLAIVVALHTGRCFCGVVGDEYRLEFTVVGDTVNVAARLEHLAKRLNRTLIASKVVGLLPP